MNEIINEIINDSGIVYLVNPKELSNTNRYKVGCSSKKDFSRLTNYKKGTIWYSVNEVYNYKEVEKELIKDFRQKYKLIAGKEYFEGNIDDMVLTYFQIISKYINKKKIENIDKVANILQIWFRIVSKYINKKKIENIDKIKKYNNKAANILQIWFRIVSKYIKEFISKTLQKKKFISQYLCLYKEILLLNNKTNKLFYKIPKKKSQYAFRYTEFRHTLENFYKDKNQNSFNNEDLDSHYINKLLEHVDIYQKSIRICDSVRKMYVFDLDKLQTKLEEKYPTFKDNNEIS